MTVTSLGDLSQSLMLRGRAGDLKLRIAQLTEELSTGQTADIAGRLGGDYSYLTDIGRNLARLDSYGLAISEATGFADATQRNLERVQTLIGDLGPSLLSAATIATPGVMDGLSNRAAQDLDQAFAALNATIAGRSLFAGMATGSPALADAEDLLTTLRTELAGLADADAVLSAAAAWFDDPGGFRSAIYQGTTENLAPALVGPDETIAFAQRADDPALRASLRDLAVAALANDPALGLDRTSRVELFSRLGNQMLTSTDGLIALRADLGHAEQRLEEARTRTATAQHGFAQARGNLISADPFETATRLEEAQGQLEALYAVTVRSSRLTLMSFLT